MSDITPPINDSFEDDLATIRPNKPDTFSGAGATSTAVKEWIFQTCNYLAFFKLSEVKKTRVAATFLKGEAALWFQDTYDPLGPPSFDEFLADFKEQYLFESSSETAWKIETIEQGGKALDQYINEFRILKTEMGQIADKDWLHRHFLRGLRYNVRRELPASTKQIRNLDRLVILVKETNEWIKQRDGERGNRSSSKVAPTSTTPASTNSTGYTGSRTPTSSTRAPAAAGAKLKKLTESERQYLRDNKGCFACREINVDHMAKDCPKFPSQPRTVKQESVSQISESLIDLSQSCPSPSLINVDLNVNGESTNGVADTAATINIISKDLVKKRNLRTQPSTPIGLRQAISRKNIIVNEKLIADVVRIPSENWTNSKPVSFAVAPLANTDVILGLPFLSDEGILIDAAKKKLILDHGNDHGNGILEEETKTSEEDLMTCESFDPPIRSQHFRSTSPDQSTSPERTARPPSFSLRDDQDNFNLETVKPQPSIDPQLATELHNQFVTEYADVFCDKLPETLPDPKGPRHRIVLDNPDISLNGRMLRLTSRFQRCLLEFINEHLRAGRIRPSSSHIASGTWMIAKKDPNAMPRVVHDYRALNSHTIKDHTPLPRQDDIIESMAKAKIRGKLDLPLAYGQVLMEESDIHKTAFKTPFGLYEWVVMPQGLCNAPATFQRFMNWILREYIGRFCAVYIDDIAIWSSSIEQHKEHIHLILQALRKAGIYVSKPKSTLFTDEIEFLGHIISSTGIQMPEDRVEKIVSAAAPRSPQEIKVFNGLINYVAQFIPGLSEWSSRLSSLTRKNVEFKWQTEHQEAFENIKRLVQTRQICKPIDIDDPTPVYVVADASNEGIGGYYGQGEDYKRMQPAGFHSRSYRPAERNYATHDKEMLAIIDCLKKWEPQLTGRQFETLTDHAPLVHFQNQRDLTPRQIRWNEYLSRFDTTIRHIPGITNSAADALSRYPYVQASVNSTSVIEFDEEILNSVRRTLPGDSLFGPVVQNPDRYPLYHMKEDLLFHQGRLCIPTKDRATREKLLKQYHDEQDHFGVDKTAKAIGRDYFWPQLWSDVTAWIKSCPQCVRNKSTTQAPAGFLHPMPIPAHRFEEIAIDFVGPLPRCKGFNSIIVMTDRLTNYVRIEPVHNTDSAKDIAEVMYRSWYRIFGLPQAITSDRDKLFTGKFWRELHHRVGIQLRMSTAYHPETDGSSERSNKTAIEALRHYTNARQSDWMDHLIHVETAMNNSVNATTGLTPNELVFGAPLRLFPTPSLEQSDVPAVSEFLERIKTSIGIAKDAHLAAKTRQATNANQHRREEPKYNIGDQVYLDTIKLRLGIKQKGRSTKLYPRYIGPFKIISTRPETSTYRLDLPPQYSIHPSFHARRLKPHVPNDPELFPDRELDRPPAVFNEDDGGEYYEVESVEDHQDLRNGRRRYLIHWKGYSPAEDEWIHEDNLDARALIEEYWQRIRDEDTA
jgi:hypothetical protein